MAGTLVTVKTNFSPPFTFDPLASGQGAKGILALIRPTVDISLPVVGNQHYAPYGEPTEYGVLLLGVVGALALYGAYKLLT